ncbi:MAG: hypothetical protein KGI78_01950 [Patescibacteria group bacterium]|nr:hypothetical protein [Patescibacteria group bacterium]MDE1944706.1 hypothetical protein [Patescibacteria group bacterium]MDE2057597.1 hypothetical protein [Patescibacteria group bacterium]
MLKERCIALRRQGHTLPEIVRATGRSKTTVYFHIQDLPLAPEKLAVVRRAAGQRIRQFALARKGKSAREFIPVTKWTPQNVLLLGHLLFDGEIMRRVCAYNNRSEALRNRVEILMQSVYAFAPSRYRNTKTGVGRIAYFNVALSEHLHDRARMLLGEIVTLQKKLKREFLRAFFDDEGCMDFMPSKRRRVRGYQKDLTILRIVKALLADFGVEARIVEPNEIAIIGKQNLERFEIEINFSPGVCINGKRTNSRWKKSLEKRELLRMAIASYKN